MFVAYTGHATRVNTGPWRPILPGSWASIRHQLESFGIESLEKEAMRNKVYTAYNGKPMSNTIIRAYEVFKPLRLYGSDQQKWPQGLQDLFTTKKTTLHLTEEIQGKAHLLPNTFLLLVRCPMPLGGRPYVPIRETSKYALMEHQLEINPSDEQLKSNMMTLKLDSQDKCHAADMSIEKHVYEGLEYEYIKPPHDYLCTECDLFGHHFKDTCWIFEKTERRTFTSTVFGAKKFGTAINTDKSDTTYYSLLHKRKNRT